MQLIIRQAGHDDLPCILGLYKELESDENAVLTQEQATAVFNRISTYPNYKIYVALAGSETVGTFSLAIMDNLAHLGMPSGLIEDVAVKSEWQGKGIGKNMMQFALERCREYGCYKAALSSNKKRVEAHRFYEALGFERHGYSFTIDF
jgi:GNAT superfamily N-acetyltransferase